MPNPGHKRKIAPNLSQRPGTTTAGQRPSTLPPQYNFTPAVQAPQPLQTLEEPIPVLPANNSEEVQFNPQNMANPQQDAPASHVQQSPAQSHPSFQDENALVPEITEDNLRALNALLLVPDRDKFTTVLSPTPVPETTWYDRDKGSKLVRKITKVIKNKFDAPYYSWTCVPRDKQERYFLEFAKTHTWDPLITGTVQQHFEEICQRKMKDMEEELGRPVSLGENVQEKLSELEAEAAIDTSAVSDGASRLRELTTEEYTAIFLKSTDRDSRGNFYGVGNLKDCLVNGKRKQPDSASSFVSLQEQLKEAQRKIEDQAAREAEQSRAVAEQKDRLEQLSLVEKYLRQTDPHFLDFMASQSAKEPTSYPLSITLPLDDTTTTPSPSAS
ncbi:unnamed protein product [Arabidopsis arenosa]|uniref:Uncharacterized protein n=1 Tax=Arabidopsis arenosa TaxID=38785 RepID=A0A8S2AVL6_ARAAE|nr:unnamed protein product [Arabidopsis arenosa]